MNRLAGYALLLLAQPWFAQMSCAQAVVANPNSIQPETTLSITAEGSVTRQPDNAFITAGVQNEAKTAKEAVAANARNMAGVIKALKTAGIADKDVQTANFSLNPRYDYVKDSNTSGRQVLAGYGVTNQVTARVTKLDTLGAVLDSLVSAGGNTVNDIRFALHNDQPARDEARRLAMQAAVQRANLYAEVAGYKVTRIVSINESFQSYEPQPKVMMARAMVADAAPTPIASGELTFTANITVLFELKK